jgi:tRNA (cmo5U34)-methyltransferase
VSNPLRAAVTPGSWVFDEQVAGVFDDMLRRSIPGFLDMRETCAALGRHLLRPGSLVVDLGCSLGGALAPYVSGGSQVHALGFDTSQPMLDIARARFQEDIEGGRVRLAYHDLTDGYPDHDPARLVLFVLTLQFVPVPLRPQLLRAAFDHLEPGGALLLVEKVVAADEDVARLLVRVHHEQKERNGYTREEIRDKDIALIDRLVPLTAAQNEALLADAGFRTVECVWRCLNFAGWIATRQ